MSKLLDLDSPFMSAMYKVSDLIIVNVLYIICCIPVVTIGAATSALYYTTLKVAEDRGSSVVKSYFHSFRDNFKQGTIIWLFVLLAGIILGLDFYILYLFEGGGSKAVRVLLMVPVIALIFTVCYVFPLLARFENTVKKTIVNAFLLSIGNLPKTIAAVALNVLPIGILYLSLRFVPFTFLIGFSGAAFLNSLMFLKIFERIMPKEEGQEEALSESEEIH